MYSVKILYSDDHLNLEHLANTYLHEMAEKARAGNRPHHIESIQFQTVWNEIMQEFGYYAYITTSSWVAFDSS